MSSESESISSDEESPQFQLVSSTTFHRLAELAPAATHNRPLTYAEMQATSSMQHETRMASFETRQKITRIDAHINALQQQRRTLISEATTQQSVLQLCDKLKAPIRRIPQDIVREIAIFCLPPRPTPSSQDFPLVFSHVCSLWRTVALSTPRIWSTLYLTVKATESLAIYTEVVFEWLKRANTTPSTLFIYFQLDASAIVKAEWNLRQFLIALSPAVTRIQHLGIGSSRSESLRILFNPPLEWDLPTLYQLDIHSTRATQLSGVNRADTPATDALRANSFTPALTNLVLDSIITSNYGFMCIPWSQLTRICVSKPAIIADLITVMGSCTNLRIGVFTVMDDNRTPFPTPTMQHIYCSVEKLSLEICANCPHLNFVDLLSLFRLPNLVDLDLLRADMDFWSADVSPFAQSLSVSYFPRLNRLYLNGTSGRQMLLILSAAASVRELTISTISLQFPALLLENMTYEVGQGIAIDGSSGNILPCLSMFRIDVTHNPVLDDGEPESELLRKMLGSRRGEALPTGCQRLDRVIFNVPDASTDLLMTMDLMGLEGWCKNIGLKADIYQPGNSSEKGYVPRVAPFDERLWRDGYEDYTPLG